MPLSRTTVPVTAMVSSWSGRVKTSQKGMAKSMVTPAAATERAALQPFTAAGQSARMPRKASWCTTWTLVTAAANQTRPRAIIAGRAQAPGAPDVRRRSRLRQTSQSASGGTR